MLRDLARLEGSFRFLRERGDWLWLALALGAGLRAWLVLGTPGTLDVVVWEGHAREILDRGLIATYHSGQYIFNHPPLMGEVFSRALALSVLSGISFEVWLRAPFALLDFGTALLLLRLLGKSPYRYVLFAGYWLFPLSILLSAYHGNTDSALAFFLVASVLLVSRGSALAAGAVLGVGLWIKFPAILAAPALLLAFPRGADRLRFAASLIVVGVASYVPALLRDAEVVVRSVFLYAGLQIQSPAGVRIWGTQLFYPDDALAPGSSHGAGGLFRALLRNNTWICVAPIALVAWARRDGRSRLEIAGNVGASYAIFHGLTNFWAWQYLAWALPLWWAAGWRTAMPACAVATVYVYVLYVWLCGDPWLAGSWDWLGQPHWPAWLLRLREAAVLGFFATALALVAQAILAELRRARGPRAGEPTS